MKIVTVFKWQKNPQDARVSNDGKVNWQGVKMSVNDDDPAVMETAAAIAQGGEVIALTIGDGDNTWSAARGAAHTIVVTDATVDSDSAATAAVLSAEIKKLAAVDVVIIGDSDWDYGAVAALAGQLDMLCLAGITSVENNGDTLKVTQKSGNTAQVIEVKVPVLLAVSATHSEKNAPGLKDVIAARKKPVDKITIADLTVEHSSKAVSQGTRLPDTPPAQIIDGSDAVAACQQLMTALHTDGVL